MAREISHEEQQRIWDEEHRNPKVLLQMDSRDVSSGVAKFSKWMEENGLRPPQLGIEVGCGKGRNVIGLAKEGHIVHGIDFSQFAIEEAKRRAIEEGVPSLARFRHHDATRPWPFFTETFDFGIDCFATSDIESAEGRAFAGREMARVMKPGGHLLVYNLSPEDEFHAQMIASVPGSEKNSFVHPTGKFEKAFDADEIIAQYENLGLVTAERYAKRAVFNGKEYDCLHHWMVFRKMT